MYAPPVPVLWTVTIADPAPPADASVTLASASLNPAKSTAPAIVRVASFAGVAPPSKSPLTTIFSVADIDES